MSQELHVGTTASRTFTIDADRVIDFMGDDARVYATPALVRDIEQTSRDMIVALLPDGQDSVGTLVNIAHMAATLEGMEVTVTVTVAELDGRRVVLDIEARDALEPICKGRHERFIVDTDKTVERLRAKAARAAEQAG